MIAPCWNILLLNNSKNKEQNLMVYTKRLRVSKMIFLLWFRNNLGNGENWLWANVKFTRSSALQAKVKIIYSPWEHHKNSVDCQGSQIWYVSNTHLHILGPRIWPRNIRLSWYVSLTRSRILLCSITPNSSFGFKSVRRLYSGIKPKVHSK